jgi:hypothetical protein
MTPCTTLVAPYLYPAVWIGYDPAAPAAPVVLSPMCLHILKHIKRTGRTSVPCITRALGTSKWSIINNVDKLVMLGRLNVIYTDAQKNHPRKFYEVKAE